MSTLHSTRSMAWTQTPVGGRFPVRIIPGRPGSARSFLRRVRAWAPDLALALAVAVAVVLASCSTTPSSTGSGVACVGFDSLPA